MTPRKAREQASGSLRRAAALLAMESTGAVATIASDFSGPDACEVVSAIKAAVLREATRHNSAIARGVVRDREGVSSDTVGAMVHHRQMPRRKVVLYVVGDQLSSSSTANGTTSLRTASTPQSGLGRTVNGVAEWLRNTLCYVDTQPRHSEESKEHCLASGVDIIVPTDAASWSVALAMRTSSVVVTQASDLLSIARDKNCVHPLTRAHLLVYDAAERARHPRDPVACLLRDGAPPRSLRIFGVARSSVGEGDRAAIEDALKLRWFAGGADAILVMREKLIVRDRSSFAPLVEHCVVRYSLPDVPIISVGAVDEVHGDGGRAGDDTAAASGRTRSARHVNDKAYIISEVGPLGLVLYERRANLRRLRWKYRRLMQKARALGDDISIAAASGSSIVPDETALNDALDDVDEAGGRDLLLGLHPKALSLLNLLCTSASACRAGDVCLAAQGTSVEGCRRSLLRPTPGASGEASNCSLNAIVYCGQPAVAAALNEIVVSLPGFAGVSSRVLLGDPRAAKPLQTFSDMSDGYDPACGWQGAETDEEAIGAFAVGDTNILFVASANGDSIAQNYMPLPPSTLVLRYDGSACNYEADGGGGRCRVVTFLPKTRYHGNGNAAGNRRNIEREGVQAGASGEKIGRSAPSRQVNGEKAPAKVTGDIQEQMSSGKLTPRRKVTATGSKVVRYEDVDGAVSSFSFKVNPAQALLGPSDSGGETCFLYRVSPVLAGATQRRKHFSQQSRTCDSDGLFDYDRTGLSSYVLVLSKDLHDRDLFFRSHSGRTLANDGESVSEGKFQLSRAGSIVLNREQVQDGRRYTGFLLGTAVKKSPAQMFQWGNTAAGNGDQTRRYLVLPLKRRKEEVAREAAVWEPSQPPSLASRQEVLFFYFGSEFIGSGASIGEGCTPRQNSPLTPRIDLAGENHFQSVEDPDPSIDWECIRAVALFEAESIGAERVVSTENTSRWLSCISHPDPFGHMEGKLIYSAFDGKRQALLAGRLRYELSPLTGFVHQKKFPLRPDGNFEDEEAAIRELVARKVKLMPAPVPETETPAIAGGSSKKRKRDISINELSSDGQREGEDGKRSLDHTPLLNRGAVKKARMMQGASDTILHEVDTKADTGVESGGMDNKVPRGDISKATSAAADAAVAADGSRTIQKFDCEKNVQRNRVAWYGPVAETYESYFQTTRGAAVSFLHQPLCFCVPPDTYQMTDVMDVAKGTPVATPARYFLNAQMKANPDGVWSVPAEFAVPHPIKESALLLPPVLLRMEEHLGGCALRDLFADKVEIDIDVAELAIAVTSTSVNSSLNYERLELLGDAVLKLASTLRLFVREPHKAEGELHPLRCQEVCNATLQSKAHERGLQHFLNFSSTSVQDWTPPGWDADAPTIPVPEKALADVVEALTGAYYLRGAAVAASKRKSPAAEVPGGDSEVVIQRDAAAQSDKSRAGADVADSGSGEMADGRDEENTDDAVDSANDDNSGETDHGILPILDPKSITAGYRVGTLFLESLDILEGSEPTHEEILLSAIHAMHPIGTPAPTAALPSSFPRDKRLTSPTKPWAQHLGLVEQEIGYRFKNRQLLMAAFTHGSWTERLAANGEPVSFPYETFQRLEFLGDAAIDFCVASYLFARYSNQGPGELTELKSAVVSNEAFARISVKHNLHNFLYCKAPSMWKEVNAFVASYKDERKAIENGHLVDEQMWSRKREAPKILGDIFEAIAGAILVDAGLEKVWNVSLKLLDDTLQQRANPAKFATHPVKMLQDFVTKDRKLSVCAPLYVVPERPVPTGKTHSSGRKEKLMRAEVYIHSIPIAHGFAASKKRAMAIAARNALAKLQAASDNKESAKLMEKLLLAGDEEKTAQGLKKQNNNRS